MQKYLLYVWIVASMLSFAPCAIAETAGQGKTTNAVIIEDENPQILKQANTHQNNPAFEQTLIQEKLDSFEKRADDLKWVITTTLAVIIVGGGLLMWKNQREYDRSLNDIKEAEINAKDYLRKAENSCAQSEKMEKEVKEIFEKIDQKVDIKLHEIDIKVKQNIDRFSEDVQKQREIRGLWYAAFKAEQEKIFELADELWSKIIEDNPQDYEAYYNWGNCLSGWASQNEIEVVYLCRKAEDKYRAATKIKPNFAESFYRWGLALKRWADHGLFPKDTNLYELSCEKFQEAIRHRDNFPQAYLSWAQTLNNWATFDEENPENLLIEACNKSKNATEIKPDYYDAYLVWGLTLGRLGLCTGKDDYLESSIDKLLQAEKIKPGSAAYGLACSYAIMHNEEKCRHWLNVAQQKEMLPTYAQVEKNEHLEPYINKDWFKNLWRKEPNLE